MTRSIISSHNPESVTWMNFPSRHHFQADNKEAYSHDVKLPDGRFGEIRFFAYLTFSGSVSRSGNKQSDNHLT